MVIAIVMATVVRLTRFYILYAPISDPEYDNDKDDIYSLGIHLINDHNCTDKSDFNKIYRVLILEVCSPNSLEVKEHKWIYRLNSLI